MSEYLPRISLDGEPVTAGDAPPFKLESMLDLCGLFMLGLAFAAGMFCGGLLVAFFRDELSALCWTALNIGY